MSSVSPGRALVNIVPWWNDFDLTAQPALPQPSTLSVCAAGAFVSFHLGFPQFRWNYFPFAKDADSKVFPQETAGFCFEELSTRMSPPLETAAGHSGQSVSISESQRFNFRRKKRSAQYSRVPSCFARPPVENRGIHAELPFSDQVFQTSHR